MGATETQGSATLHPALVCVALTGLDECGRNGDAELRFTLRYCVAALQAWENEGVAAGWLDIDILNTDPRNVNRGVLSGNNLMFIRPENCRAPGEL